MIKSTVMGVACGLFLLDALVHSVKSTLVTVMTTQRKMTMKINEYLGVDWYDTFNVEDYFYILEDYYY